MLSPFHPFRSLAIIIIGLILLVAVFVAFVPNIKTSVDRGIVAAQGTREMLDEVEAQTKTASENLKRTLKQTERMIHEQNKTH